MRASTRRGTPAVRPGAASALALALILGAAAAAEEPAPSSPEPVVEAGMKVAIDPATGKLRPATAAESAALEALAAERARQLPAPLTATVVQPVEWPDGTVTVDVEGLFMNFSVVRLGEHGLEAACVDGAEATHSYLDGGAVVALEER